jgi:hypothetical protein
MKGKMMTDPDNFDSAAFADLLHDAAWTIALVLLVLAVIVPVLLP